MALSGWQKIALLAGLPLTGILLYLLLRQQEDADDEPSRKQAMARPKSVEIGIPGSSVGRIIGRQGANIKRLEEQSGARCKMQDEETAGGVRMLRITGTPDAIREATRLLNRSLEEVTKGNLSFQMHVPNEAVGRIIGKNGANIKDLILASGARVDVEHKPAAGQDSSRRRIITIAGTQQQVDCAKAMIQEVVDEHYRSVAGDRRRPLGGQDDKSQPGVTRNQQRGPRSAQAAAQMPPDGNREEKWDFTNTQPAYTPCDTDLAVSPAAGSSSSSSRRVDPGVEQLTMDEDGYAETYVSAVESPNHFWLQVVREKSRALDRLVDDMNAHYALCPPSEEDEVVPRPGDLVATDFVYDNGWYRARVLTVTGDLVTVYYPDFGDTGQVLASRLRKLSRAFLVLPFQAIECYTARQMAPADGGDAWSEAAIQRFEELVFCAKWKVLMCSVMQTEAGRPYVELVDTHGNANVNIADEMVRSGQARWASAADHAHVAPSDDHCSQVTPPAEADDSVIIIDNSPAKVDEAAEDSSQSHRGEASLQSSFGEFSMLQSTGIESSPYDSEPDVDVTETIDSTSSFLSASDDGSSTHLIDSTVSVTDASSFAYESSVQDASAIAPGDTAANTGSADARRNGGGDGGDGNSELGGNTTSGEYSLLSSTKFASESPPVTSPNKRAAGDMESTVLVASPPGGTGKGEFPSGIEDISMIPGNAASSSMIDGSTMQDSAATINPLELNQFSATFEQISRDAAAADDE